MKKRWKKIAVAALVVVLFLMLIGFFRHPINPFQVDKIELQTYDHKDKGKAELTKEEAWKLLALYNSSRRAGQVNAEPCCDAYGFEVYFDDGSTLYVGQGVRSQIIVRPTPGVSYYLENQQLIDYIYELAEKYDLPIE